MVAFLLPNPSRIVSSIIIVCLAIFSSGCYGDIPAPQQPVNPPTPVVVKVELPTVGSSPVTKVLSNTTVPTVVPNPLLPLTLTVPPPMTIGELLEGTAIHDLRVGIISEGDPRDVLGQACSFSPDNFFTCAALNRLTQTIRVTFTLNHRGDLSATELELLHASMEVVVYPYRMISRYTPAPPLVDEPIREVTRGVWGTDFHIHSPDRAFSFYLMAEGRSLTGANLYLVQPETFLAAPLAEEEQEN